MKKFGLLVGAATAAMAMTAGAASAEVAYTGNVALATDYTFRGISQTNESPAISGGFDATSDIFYAGVWGSTIDFAANDAELEIDLYAGVKPVVGPVTFDLGVIGYFYPDASNEGGPGGTGEADYIELKAGASIAPAEGFSIGGNLWYSPEFTLDPTEGDGLFIEGYAAYTVSDMFSFSGGVGNQSVDNANYYGVGEDSYTTWNLGGTLSWEGFGFDLRYVDTDLDNFPAAEERVVFSIKRAL
jgi:uncharacterized protein (TIGR02001 family)